MISMKAVQMPGVPLAKFALVVVYAFDARDTLERLVKVTLEQPAPLHVFIINDNSSDESGLIADQLARHDDRVQVFHRPRNLGRGAAYRLGCEYALRSGYGRMVTINADFTHNPRYIPQLLAASRSNDLAIGSRLIPGGGSIGHNPLSMVISRMTNRIIRNLLRLTPYDCTSQFRCYTDHVLQQIHPETMTGDRYSFLIESLVRCAKSKFRVVEIPYIYDDRGLAPKRSLLSGSQSAFSIFRLWLNSRRPGRWQVAQPEQVNDQD
jgi:dolichol-phosphate mannosyltransferase